MIYQVLSRPRTGSGVVYQHAWKNSEGIHLRLGEYFNTQDTPEKYEEKFKFLETGKEDNRHYCLKVRTGQIRDVPRIINYFKDYHVYIVDRNPWNSYLSYMFCELHNWNVTHRFRDMDGEKVFGKWTKAGRETTDIDTENFVLPINEDNLKQYVKVYKRDLELIEDIKYKLPDYTVFDYDELDSFTEYRHTQKHDIDYEKHIPYALIDHYKTMFDKCLNE